MIECLQKCARHDHRLVFLMTLFNKIFDNREYPKAWRVPSLKTGNPDSLDNYTGVSLISTVSKMIAYILNLRITKWTDENGRKAEEQSCLW